MSGNSIPSSDATSGGWNDERIVPLLAAATNSSTVANFPFHPNLPTRPSAVRGTRPTGTPLKSPVISASAVRVPRRWAFATIAFGVRVVAGDVYHEGISGITPADITFARRLGYEVKLLAIAEAEPGQDDMTEVAVREDGALRLRPLKAVGRTLPAGLGDVLTGSLPLPRLPIEAQLVEIEHGPGRLSLTVALEDFDEALDLGAPDRLRARLEDIEQGRRPTA